KNKRVDTSRVMESQWAQRRRDFIDSGAPVSILFLLIFSFLMALVMGLGSVSGEARLFWQFHSLDYFAIEYVLMLILSLGFALYALANEPQLIKRHLRSFHILFNMLVMVLTVRFIVYQEWSPYLICVPVMITGISMTIAYNQRFALGISGYLILLAMLAMADSISDYQQGLGVLLANGSCVGISVMMLKKIRTFTKLIEVSALSSVMSFLVVFVFGMLMEQGYKEVLIDCCYASGGIMAVGFIMHGLLPLIERMFHAATDMSLLSYGEATQPLLKRLAVEAPGTFNHSWQIGMLSEAAAEAIGANGLLCRVGCYYHDVGKLNKPRYFIENQQDSFNQHKELSPTMSRMIIVGHVKDGMELLEQYRIPRILRQFCETHHGTTLVQYFYHAATQKSSETGEVVEESDFRYPGPKPRTKEAAIVMLADVVEGATRAMKDPTPSRIETLVHNMAMSRLQDGQLSDCDLTIRELSRIEHSLVKSLCAMYHGRISYPGSASSDGDKK
ncbi:MAG: HDIG domain-containing protein, partial [Sedimentisphaerales bacterium]|nr:HDIG domain-containing protein [Sedimentisphaerales bacterium]